MYRECWLKRFTVVYGSLTDWSRPATAARDGWVGQRVMSGNGVAETKVNKLKGTVAAGWSSAVTKEWNSCCSKYIEHRMAIGDCVLYIHTYLLHYRSCSLDQLILTERPLKVVSENHLIRGRNGQPAIVHVHLCTSYEWPEQLMEIISGQSSNGPNVFTTS